MKIGSELPIPMITIWEVCPLVKYNKTTLRMPGSVQASDSFTSIGAGRVGNSKTHAFYAISIQNVEKQRFFQVIAQVLFRQGSDTAV